MFLGRLEARKGPDLNSLPLNEIRTRYLHNRNHYTAMFVATVFILKVCGSNLVVGYS
jgi:hypothetical protein